MRKTKPRADGKCRLATLEAMAAGPVPPPGVLVSCGCPVLWRVAPTQVKKRCLVCHKWRQVEE